MPVVQRHRSVFDRLMGAHRPSPVRFDPYRSAARSDAASEEKVSAGRDVSLPGWIIPAVFVVALGLTLGYLFKDRIGQFATTASTGRWPQMLAIMIPAILLALKIHQLQQWVMKRVFSIATYRPDPMEQSAGASPAAIERRVGRGVVTFILVMLLVNIGLPMIYKFMRTMGLDHAPFANLLPIAAVIALVWHRHGTPPWVRQT